MNKKNKSKVWEFLTLLTMIVGIVVGSGEFIKNDDTPGHILFVSNNGYLAVLVWVIIGICCIFMMVAFIEIASSTEKEGNGTLANWSKKFISRRAGSLVSIFYIFFYTPILYALFGIVSMNFFLTAIQISFTSFSVKVALVYISGGVLIISFFTLLNAFFRKQGKYFQIIGTFIKFIPFILILIAGFFWIQPSNVFNDDKFQKWKISNFFLVSAPIMFSFDGFIFAANLQK